MPPQTSILNPEQQLCVQHIEGPVLVLAGAGSGKTRVVTERIAHLINIGVSPSEILAVTFTNKAAQEMQSRIKVLTHNLVWVSTFHSLGARILRESIHHLGYGNQFNIYDETDSEQLIKQCLQTHLIKDDKSMINSFRSAISAQKNQLMPPADNLAALDSKEQLFQKVYRTYCEKLKEYNALDFDDLLFLTATLFQNHPEVKQFYQNRFRFVLVDEYQDTNFAQYTLIKLLVESHRNLFVVGDPDQSIYSWRGALVENILNFEKDFAPAKVIYLEQNYRSTSTILKAANQLISHNENRYPKNLWSTLGEGDKISLRTFSNDLEEASAAIETIVDQARKRFLSYKDCAIFYRTNFQSRTLEDALLRKKVPYVIVGGISFYQRREIKDLLAFLKFAAQGCDFISFVRTINLPKRGFGKKALETLQEQAEQSQKPLLNFLLEDTHTLKLSTRQLAGLQEYLQLICSLRDMHQNKQDVHSILKELLALSSYMNFLKEDLTTYEERKENVEELLSKAAQFDEANLDKDSPSLTPFLEELSLTTSTQGNLDGDAIYLMTLHNSKGLEFDLVYLVGLEEDLMPHINSKEDFSQLEEERRLLYVGMTRAKKHLFLSNSKMRMLFGTTRMMFPSRFLKEIPEEFIQKDLFASEQGPFPVGSYVEHPTFGIGVVRRHYESSLGLSYEIQFSNFKETRTLVAKFAKLTLL